mmetsp:Transcript_32913/g.35495  ORF Transcript_32913/g.35495 Transcript_32913/m.35495 type:complete len:82 (+) Transcript_32913:668-913(+)
MVVTVDNETCQKSVEGGELCLDGTTPSSWGGGRGSSYAGSRNSDSYDSSARETSHGAVSFLLALWVLVATLFQWLTRSTIM